MVKEDEITVVDDVNEVPVSSPAGAPVPVAEKVQASSGPVVPVVPVAVSGSSGSPVGSSQTVSAVSDYSCVASGRIFTRELRRKFFLGYRDMLCQCSGNAAFVFSYRNGKVCGVSPADNPDEVRITFESGGVVEVHANLVRISNADTSDEMSEVEFAQFILKVKDDPSYRISFRGSIVDSVGSTEHSNVLWAGFTDHTGPQCRRLPAKALSVKNIALNSNSSVNNVNKASSSSTVLNSNSSGANVNSANNVNKAPSSSTVGDGIVNVSRNSSRSVVPTAAVLAAELLKRTIPPSVVGVPKCRV